MWVLKQNETCGELSNFYKEAKEKYKEAKEKEKQGKNNPVKKLFYEYLEEILISKIKLQQDINNRIKTFNYYKLSCKSYIDSDYLDFNMAMVAIIISILTVVNMVELSMTAAVLLIIVLVIIVVGGIYHHNKKSIMIDILYVLENINKDSLKNSKGNKK